MGKQNEAEKLKSTFEFMTHRNQPVTGSHWPLLGKKLLHSCH